MAGILVIGSINADISISVDKAPKIGETVKGKNYHVGAGGKGANQAIACAHFGKNVSMIGLAGNDGYADMCINNLSNSGVDVSGIEKYNINTGVAVITVVNGDNSIILNDRPNSCVTLDYIKSKEELIKEADYVVFQFEIPIDVVFEAIRYVKRVGKKVVLNPAPIYEISEEIFSLTDIFILNEHEAGHILGYEVNLENAHRAVEEIANKGTGQVVITLGGDGCVYNDGKSVCCMEAKKVAAVDTTAAGDTFIGAFCVSLSENKTLKEAIEFATNAAAITVSRAGAAESIPTYEEVRDYIEREH